MSGFQTKVEIKKFLWNYNLPNKNDKIWGFVLINEKLYCFWGRRGTGEKGLKALRFKREDNIFELEDISRYKIRKGYESQNLAMVDGQYVILDRIYPGFVDHLRSQLMLARLSGSVMKETSG